MGAFNRVKVQDHCPACKSAIERYIQFKYGDTWQHEYNIGDLLAWGGNDIGEPRHKRVVVDGVAENCPICRAEGGDYEVWLEQDRIVSVKPASGIHDFVSRQQSFIVIEE